MLVALVIFHKMLNLTPSLLVNEPFHDSVPNHDTITWDQWACSPVEKQVFLGHFSTSTLYVVPVPTCACAFLTPKHCGDEIPCYRIHYSSTLNFRQHLEILVWILDGVPLKGQTKPQWKQCTDGTDFFISALSLRTVQKARDEQEEQQEIERQNALRALWMNHSTEAPFFSDRIYCATICLSQCKAACAQLTGRPCRSADSRSQRGLSLSARWMTSSPTCYLVMPFTNCVWACLLHEHHVCMGGRRRVW